MTNESPPLPSKWVTVPGARSRLEKYAIVPEATARLDDEMVFLWSPPAWTIADAKEHIVEGYASLPNLDDQGDIIPIDVIADALPDFMKWANGREMHDKKAAGKIVKAVVDDKGLWVVYKVTDPTAWAKCETATYQGFSVGGDVTKLERRPDGVRVITGLRINEISLVDRPANQDAKIYVMKAAVDPLIEKYSDDEPRDDHGRWTEGGGGGAAQGAKSWQNKMGGREIRDLKAKRDQLAQTEKPSSPKLLRATQNLAEAYSGFRVRHGIDYETGLKSRSSMYGKAAGGSACEKHHLENCEECGCDRTVGHPTGSSPEAERPGKERSQKAADLSRETSASKKKEYGNVTYGDPEHHAYPLNTAKRVRAAWSYVHHADNRKGRSSSNLASIEAKIRAAAKRFGITLDTNKSTTTMTLEKVRALLDDPADLAVVDSFEKLLISKGATEEWHTQSDVGDINSKTRSGLTYENEGDDIGDEELPLDDFLKAIADSEDDDDEDDQKKPTEKAGGNMGANFKECAGHIKALASHFQSLTKAMSDGNTEACKASLTSCKGAFVKMHKAMHKAQKAQKAAFAASLEKVNRPSVTNGIGYRQLEAFERSIEKSVDNKIEEAVLPLINRLKRLQNFIAGLPISKVQSRSHLELVAKDDENTSALDATKRAMGMSR